MGRKPRGKRKRRRRAEAPKAKGLKQSLPPFGLPGQHQSVLMRPRYKDGDERNDVPVGGSPGKYRVVFTLARPGVLPKPETEFSFDEGIPGDSHLAVSSPAVTRSDSARVTQIRVSATTDDGEIVFDGFPNAGGYLGRLVTELQGNDLRDAEHKAYRALAPTLSNWSAQLDVPVHIWRTQVTSLETRAQKISVVNPYLSMPMALVDEGTMSPAYRGLISLYREALESRSPVYQFLCFFKIAEGIRNLRDRFAADARNQGGQPPTRPAHRVPKEMAEDEGWLSAIYPGGRKWDAMSLDSIFVVEARGRKLNDLVDKELTDLRVDVAHALSEGSGDIALVADEALHMVNVNKWLPLMKCIVRRWLKDDFQGEFLPGLKEDGT